MIAVRIPAIAVTLAACATSQPFRATHRAATVFEGKRLEVVSGFAVSVSCTEPIVARITRPTTVPLWPDCGPMKSTREYSTRMRWGEELLRLYDGGSDAVPPPPPRSITARRLTGRVIAVQVTTDAPASIDAWRFFVKRLRDPRYDPTGGAVVHLRGNFTLAQARDQAIRERWLADDLVLAFGWAPEIAAYAIEIHDDGFLRANWLRLDPDLQQRALAGAIARSDRHTAYEPIEFLIEHWRWLGHDLLAPGVEALIATDHYSILGEDGWWRTMPDEHRKRLLDHVIAAPASPARTNFLERRRDAGDARARAALPPARR